MKKFIMGMCILLCCMAVGCTKKNPTEQSREKEKETETKTIIDADDDSGDRKEEQTGMQVTVWFDAESGYANRQAVGAYESGEEATKGNEELESYYMDISWNIVDKSYLTPEQYRKELQEALERGEGPDIIYMDTYNQISPQEMMESGRLAEIVDPADVYGEDIDYLAGVLEAGQQDGKQYVLPIGVQCPVLFGIQDDLEEAGIDVENGYHDLKELLTALLAAHEAAGRDIFENTQALDWLEQYYIDEKDAETHELIAQARECCGSDNGVFAAYDALNSKKALLGSCGVLDSRKAGQNLCLLSKDQQPAFLYVPAADGVKRAVVTQAAGINAQSENAAEISRVLMMYRKDMWFANIVGLGPYASDRDYWKVNLNSYVYSVSELSDRKYAMQAAALPDKTVAAYRKLVSDAVLEASYAVTPSAGGDSAAAIEKDKKVISVFYSDYGLGEDSGTGHWLRRAAEGFNASQEEYYVQLMRSGEASLIFPYEEMEACEGTGPDIVLFPMLEGTGFQYADMSEFLKHHSGELSFLPDGMAGGIECGGVVSGLPYAAEEYGIWCSQETLRSAGLSQDWAPKDMQELTEGLRQLKGLQGIETAAALDGDFVKPLFTFMNPGQLDTYLNKNSKGEWQISAGIWTEYMEALQQFRDEKLAVPLAWRDAGITAKDAAAGLAEGTVGAVLADSTFGGWYDGAHGLKLADGQREQLVFVPLAPLANVDVFRISAHSKYPEAAAEFWLYAILHESYAQLEADDGKAPLTQLSKTVQAAMPCQPGGADTEEIVNGLWQLEQSAGETAGENQWFESAGSAE